MNRIGLGMGLVGLGLVACASAPPPHERQASSEAAVRGAREIGAEHVPQAALHLKLAEEGVGRAKAQMHDGDNRAADYTLMRAQADAELALALTRENRARIEAQHAIDKTRGIGGGPTDVKRAAPSTEQSPPAKDQPPPAKDQPPPAKDQPPSGSTPAPKTNP